MNREQVMERARAAGLIVQPCVNDDGIAVRAEKVTPDRRNVRMLVTANGQLLMRGDDGYFWQIGTVDDVARYVDMLNSRGRE